MTEAELRAMEARARQARGASDVARLAADVLELAAEVRRLRQGEPPSGRRQSDAPATSSAEDECPPGLDRAMPPP